MKKVILTFGGTLFSEGAFRFAHGMGQLQPIMLAGVFLPETAAASLWNNAESPANPPVPATDGNEAELTQKNIEHFKQLCQSNNIEYRVHKDFHDFALPELKKESRYADLMIIGSEVFYKSLRGDIPGNYLEDVLLHVDCPLVLVPEEFTFPESNILAYDGSVNAVFALKQFAYIFPGLTGRPTMLIYANEDEPETLPDKMLIEELASKHFNDLVVSRANADAKKIFDSWLMEHHASLLVSGAYGRSGLSQIFKNSFIRDLVAEHRIPIFIAHK